MSVLISDEDTAKLYIQYFRPNNPKSKMLVQEWVNLYQTFWRRLFKKLLVMCYQFKNCRLCLKFHHCINWIIVPTKVWIYKALRLSCALRWTPMVLLVFSLMWYLIYQHVKCSWIEQFYRKSSPPLEKRFSLSGSHYSGCFLGIRDQRILRLPWKILQLTFSSLWIFFTQMRSLFQNVLL